MMIDVLILVAKFIYCFIQNIPCFMPLVLMYVLHEYMCVSFGKYFIHVKLFVIIIAIVGIGNFIWLCLKILFPAYGHL